MREWGARAGAAACFAAVILTAALSRAGGEGTLSPGQGEFVFTDWEGNRDKPLAVWYYLPANLAPAARIVFVLHGSKREADIYLKPWVQYARRDRFLVLCPQFSEQFYPGQVGYHFGNVTDASGKRIDKDRWGFSAIEHLFDFVRATTGLTTPAYDIYGHSAGAQFVHRMVELCPDARFDRAVAANAGAYLMPSYARKFPYGLDGAGVPPEQLGQAMGRNLIILLGMRDTQSLHNWLPWQWRIRGQGHDRLERGLRFFAEADVASDVLAVPLRWRVVTVPDVGHSHAGMTPAAVRVLETGGGPSPVAGKAQSRTGGANG